MPESDNDFAIKVLLLCDTPLTFQPGAEDEDIHFNPYELLIGTLSLDDE